MFGLGVGEIVVVLALALIVLGPQRLPELARQLARLLGEARHVADEVRRNFDEPPPRPATAAADITVLPASHHPAAPPPECRGPVPAAPQGESGSAAAPAGPAHSTVSPTASADPAAAPTGAGSPAATPVGTVNSAAAEPAGAGPTAAGAARVDPAAAPDVPHVQP